MVIFEVRNRVPTEEIAPARRAALTPPRCSRKNSEAIEPNADPIRFAAYMGPICFAYDLKTSERQPPQKRKGMDMMLKKPTRFSPDNVFRDSRVAAGIARADKAAENSMLKGIFSSRLCGRITLAIAPPTPVPKRARETATKE